jgi:hypothetical protein
MLNKINDLRLMRAYCTEESLRVPINFFGFGGQLYPLSYSRNAEMFNSADFRTRALTAERRA